MSQLLAPDDYAALNLPDAWIEDMMQERQCALLLNRLKSCQTVLELGYGAGIVTRALVKAGKQVTTVDGSGDLAKKARLDGAYGIHSMFEDFQTGTKFDCVIASFVLEHVEEPVQLLKRCRQWSNKLICVIGNANSYHRQLAVHMGLQKRLESLSERDKAVGHYRVFSEHTLTSDLIQAGWSPRHWKGIMFKPLPNSMLANLPRETIRAMCEIEVPHQVAANVMVCCE